MGQPTQDQLFFFNLEKMGHGLHSECIGQVTLQYVSSNNVALQRGSAMLRVLLQACFCQLVFSLKTAAHVPETCVTWVAVNFEAPWAGNKNHSQKGLHT